MTPLFGMKMRWNKYSHFISACMPFTSLVALLSMTIYHIIVSYSSLYNIHTNSGIWDVHEYY